MQRVFATELRGKLVSPYRDALLKLILTDEDKVRTTTVASSLVEHGEWFDVDALNEIKRHLLIASWDSDAGFYQFKAKSFDDLEELKGYAMAIFAESGKTDLQIEYVNLADSDLTRYLVIVSDVRFKSTKDTFQDEE